MSDIQRIVDNSENIIEMAKRLQSSKQRYQKTLEKEQDARSEIKALNTEAHSITTAIANEADLKAFRGLDEVTRDMRKANNRVDKAIDKSHNDCAIIKAQACALMALINGNDVNVEDYPMEEIVVTVFRDKEVSKLEEVDQEEVDQEEVDQEVAKAS